MFVVDELRGGDGAGATVLLPFPKGRRTGVRVCAHAFVRDMPLGHAGIVPNISSKTLLGREQRSFYNSEIQPAVSCSTRGQGFLLEWGGQQRAYFPPCTRLALAYRITMLVRPCSCSASQGRSASLRRPRHHSSFEQAPPITRHHPNAHNKETIY